VDVNWESTVKGLYVVGEAAGSFGVYRPGGSALNAAQVGSMRAAEHIANRFFAERDGDDVRAVCVGGGESAPGVHMAGPLPPVINYATASNLTEVHKATQEAMSRYASYNRDVGEMQKLFDECRKRVENYFQDTTIAGDDEIPALFKCYDLLITQTEVLSAMIFAAKEWGSHGGAMVKDTPMSKDCSDRVVITANGESRFEPVRPIPECDDWFERDWAKSGK
jgi:succinate dehydrogenase/fumarate reductase flavoprotein subunit